MKTTSPFTTAACCELGNVNVTVWKVEVRLPMSNRFDVPIGFRLGVHDVPGVPVAV
jgi:hypothetical protein